MKYKIPILLVFFLSIFGVAQEAPNIVAVKDTSKVDEKLYPTDSLLKLNKITNNKMYGRDFEEHFQSKYAGNDFNYTVTKPRESLWEKFKKQVQRIIESIFGKVDANKTIKYTETTIKVLAVLIIGFVLYLLTRYLLRKDGNFFFSKKNAKVSILDQNLEENIHEINFNDSIVDFEKQEDYRYAVRYHFLFTLKKLADKEHINWNPEKTNKDYYNELKDNSLKNSFKELIYIFDNVWYGDFTVDKKTYTQFKQKFLNLKL